MSTRSQIGFYQDENVPVAKADVFVYRHSDGYPDGNGGVLASLVPFCQAFNNERGLDDTFYATAQFIADQVQRSRLHLEKYVKETGRNIEDYDRFLGFGVERGGLKSIHGDIEYFYHVSPTKIKVYEVHNEKPSTWKLAKEVILKVAVKSGN